MKHNSMICDSQGWRGTCDAYRVTCGNLHVSQGAQFCWLDERGQATGNEHFVNGTCRRFQTSAARNEREYREQFFDRIV